MNYSMGNMKIQQIFYKNTLRNFCYLISFDDGAIYCIDPFRADEVSAALKGYDLKAIINTHDHCDHYSGNDSLVSEFHCDVMAHPKADIPHKTKNIEDQEVICRSGEWSLVGIFAPGHTMSHLCVLLKKNESPYALFTGDCFFNAGVGNCHNGGSAPVLFETITTIFSKYPDDLLIYPGHEYLKRNLQFTLHCEPDNENAKKFLQTIENQNLDEVFYVNSMKVEREINTFLRLQSPTIKKQLNLIDADSKQVFLTLREWRNKW
jgi:hydroxyacylglutathione hydrolase